MGEEYSGSWYPSLQQLKLQTPNLNSLVYGFPELPQSYIRQRNEPMEWFYCFPHLQPSIITPSPNPQLMEKHPVMYENDTPEMGSECPEKKFIIFDRSGDQTTVLFSSGIKDPFPCLASWSPNPQCDFGLHCDVIGTPTDLNIEFGPLPKNEMQSEMHEDTEELNALLYSDDNTNFNVDNEVTSTDHSPITMRPDERSQEIVITSVGQSRKRKLFDFGNDDDVQALQDTASSVKYSEGASSAESNCAQRRDLAVQGDMAATRR